MGEQTTTQARATAPAVKPLGSLLQRACACGQHTPGGGECASCKQKRLQRSATGAGPATAPPIVHAVLGTGGQPLDAATRSYMEPRFGRELSRVPAHTPQRSAELPIGVPGDRFEREAETAANTAVSADPAGGMRRDFSHIRVHTDARAAESARAVGAWAYTVGNHIVFGAGAYAPQTTAGRHLLAHELAHTVQQVGSAPAAVQPCLLQRQSEGEAPGAAEEPQLTRAEEIALSRSSPGAFTGEAQPLALSLYNFGIDVADLKPEHQAVLTELGQFLRATATVRTIVRSIGFADSSGDAQYNLALSRRRSRAVKAFLDPLISQRVAISAYGETNPAATNETVSGRSRNRRVDIRFFVDRPPTPQPLPIPQPVPPGTQPLPIPQPVPPGTQPPGTQPPGGDDPSFCADYPLLCGIGVIPFFLPLICLVAPEVCLVATCALVPALCVVPPPPPPPSPEEPPEQPDDPDRPSVYFTPLVRAPNTPQGMNDRIGLRDPVTVLAVVLNQPPSAAPIMIFVSETGRQGGMATINGQAQINITSTTALQIQGATMTTPGYAFSPSLQLGARWGNTLVGSSNRFAVSSIAEDWSVSFDGARRGPYGYVFNADMDWVSDSGSYSHLDACAYVELVGVGTQTGGMADMGIGDVDDPDDPNTADFHPAFDEHGTPFEYTRVAGYSLLKQLWRIRDLRSNSGWAPSRNSGFTIERRFERDPANPRCWHLVVRKKGERVSIGGMSADAGSGDIDHEFRGINCDPPPPPPPGRDEPPPPPPPPPGHDDPPPPPPPPPGRDIPPATPPCDQEELARRVDQCIEEAKWGAIACTAEAALSLSGGGWSGVAGQIEYLICLRDLREALLECDQRAKADTNCPDVRVAAVEQETRRLEAEG